MIDGHEPDVVKLMLSKDMNLAFERHCRSCACNGYDRHIDWFSLDAW